MRHAVIKMLFWLPSCLYAAQESAPGDSSSPSVSSPLSLEVSHRAKKDMREEALREAALSWGMRLGLAEHMKEIEEFVRQHAFSLSRIYNFKTLLLELSSGVFLQPPVIVEADESISLEENGRVATLAQRTYRIVERARLVISERGWEEYLTFPSLEVDPPPKILFPRTSLEEDVWERALEEGREQGRQQALEIFEENLARLERDFTGQLRYLFLLRQRLVKPPYVAQKNRGVTGDTIVLRIGDQEVRVTGEAEFEQRKEKWFPRLY